MDTQCTKCTSKRVLKIGIYIYEKDKQQFMCKLTSLCVYTCNVVKRCYLARWEGALRFSLCIGIWCV